MRLNNIPHATMPLNCSSERALENKLAAVACSREKAGALSAGLRAMGAEVLTLNVIALCPIPGDSKLDEALDELDRYDWAILTSTYGAQLFIRRLQERKISAESRKTPKICAIGPATAKILREGGLQVDLIPDDFVAEGVLRALEKSSGGLQGLAGKRILLPRAQEARDVLPQSLCSAGAVVNVVPCYRNFLGTVPQEVKQRLKASPPDLLVFTSASAVNNFLTIMGNSEGQRMLHSATTAALGPVTAAAMQTHGRKADILPEENTIPSLLQAIQLHFRTRSSTRSRSNNPAGP
jgi:uroporphyrinogen III methyltransferase / synthase